MKLGIETLESKNLLAADITVYRDSLEETLTDRRLEIAEYGSAGDVNGDGYDDLFINYKPSAWDANYLDIIFGSEAFPAAIEAGSHENKLTEKVPQSLRILNAAAVGDVDHDGLDEVQYIMPDHNFYSYFVVEVDGESVVKERHPGIADFVFPDIESANPPFDFNGDGIEDQLVSDGRQVEVTFGKPRLPADLNGDGTVDFADFLVLSGNFGTKVDSHEQGDVDGNGSVDFSDFLILSASFGTSAT